MSCHESLPIVDLSLQAQAYVNQLIAAAHNKQRLLFISIQAQTLSFYAGNKLQKAYAVSTAAKGAGCHSGSYQTPIGAHCIAEKIGAGAPEGETFIGREPQHCVADIVTVAEATGIDAITSRILWLKGLEPGVNCGADVDSYQRYIYIHGTHEEGLIGQPASIGCIRMNNKDVIELFEQVEEGDHVYIMDA